MNNNGNANYNNASNDNNVRVDLHRKPSSLGGKEITSWPKRLNLRPMQLVTTTIARNGDYFMLDCKAIMTDANNLYDGYLQSIKGSKWKESTQRVQLDYLRVIFSLQKELISQTYVPGPETEFTLNERGKIRPITSLQVRDRIVRHVLCDDILMPAIRKKIIYDNGASVKGRGLSFTQKRFEMHIRKYIAEYRSNRGYIGFGDFAKFYDNMIHETAIEMLLNLCGYDSYLEWLLRVIFANFRVDCSDMPDNVYDEYRFGIFDKNEYRRLYRSNRGLRYLNKSVNVGDQLSQALGIYYPHDIDNYVKIVRGIKFYDRYMDDTAIISNSKEELVDIFGGIDEQARQIGLTLNQKKTRIVRLDEPFKFLQRRYKAYPSGHIDIHINPKTVTRLQQRLNKLAKQVCAGEIPYQDVEDMFRSSMGTDAPYMSKTQRKRIIELYENLFDCSVSVKKGNKMIIERR